MKIYSILTEGTKPRIDYLQLFGGVNES
jgi:hypothetical protein